MKAYLATLLLCAAPALAQTALPVAPVAGSPLAAPDAQPKQSANEIFKAMQAVPAPQIDQGRIDDPAYRPTLEAEVRKYRAALAPLRDEMLQNFPDHALAGQFMETWLMEQLGDDRNFPRAIKAAEEYAKTHPNTFAAKSGMVVRVRLTLAQPGLKYADGRQAIDDAIAVVGKTEDFELNLISAASDLTTPQRVDALRKLAAANPTNLQRVQEKIKQSEAIGKPFELAFKDVATGRDVSVAGLRGKIIVVDFWATWCPPCVAELPENKNIYQRYHDKGVEYIGVSLDYPEADGGKKQLLDFLAENKVPWPTYYQGNGPLSEFSTNWGALPIPAYFVIDQNGNLYTTEARGQIEEIIQKLLSTAAPKAN